jgi:hypothetical protein
VNRDQFDKRTTSAIHHWWVTMRDTGKVSPGLLDDLWAAASEHARQHAEVVMARRELRAEATAAVPVAAGLVDPVKPAVMVPAGLVDPPAPGYTTQASPPPPVAANVTPAKTLPGTSARTRTRTRGGPK